MAINNNNVNFHGPVYQSEGDQYVNAGAHAVMQIGDAQAHRAVRDLRSAVDAVPLPAGAAAGVRADLDELDGGVHSATPDKGRLGGCLERLTRVFGSVGAFLKAGATLLEPLRTLARWLGAAGVPVLALLA